MEDFSMSLGDEECAKIYFWRGKEVGSVFLWNNTKKNKFSVSIEFGGEEKFVVEVLDAATFKILKDGT